MFGVESLEGWSTGWREGSGEVSAEEIELERMVKRRQTDGLYEDQLLAHALDDDIGVYPNCAKAYSPTDCPSTLHSGRR